MNSVNILRHDCPLLSLAVFLVACHRSIVPATENGDRKICVCAMGTDCAHAMKSSC